MTDSKSNDPMVAALLRERASLVQRGLDDRVRQVDEQLALRGYDSGEFDDAPKGRKAPAKHTTAKTED